VLTDLPGDSFTDCCNDLRYSFAHPHYRRALPIDVPASASFQKARKVLLASLRNAVFDSDGVNLVQQAVSAQAAGGWPEASCQIEPDHDFQHLFV